jgi:F1F0 ATPase subunit 2
MLVGLEVDGQRMNTPIIALYVVGGIAAGTLYFVSLWWNTRLFGRDGRVSTLIAATAARFILLAGLLTAASFAGAMPLLATAAGVLIARAAVLRWTRMTAP